MGCSLHLAEYSGMFAGWSLITALQYSRRIFPNFSGTFNCSTVAITVQQLCSIPEGCNMKLQVHCENSVMLSLVKQHHPLTRRLKLQMIKDSLSASAHLFSRIQGSLRRLVHLVRSHTPIEIKPTDSKLQSNPWVYAAKQGSA